MNLVDSNGLWPTKSVMPVHQNAIDRALPFLSSHDRDILKEQQKVADEDQSLEGSYKHAMAEPGDDYDTARKKSEDYIRDELAKARAADKACNHDEALRHVGNAMHVLQDSTSPEHAGFNTWHGEGDWMDALSHVNGELFDPGPGSSLDRATTYAWELYMNQIPGGDSTINWPTSIPTKADR